MGVQYGDRRNRLFGLTIVAEVVEAHGWSIDVAESEAGGFRLAVAVGDSRSRLE